VEETEVGDLKTLCRSCHRIEHDLPVILPAEIVARVIEKALVREIPLPVEEVKLMLGYLADSDWNDPSGWPSNWISQALKGSVRFYCRITFGEMSFAESCQVAEDLWTLRQEPEEFLALGDLCDELKQRYWNTYVR
jgi:hypothetical protein